MQGSGFFHVQARGLPGTGRSSSDNARIILHLKHWLMNVACWVRGSKSVWRFNCCLKLLETQAFIQVQQV